MESATGRPRDRRAHVCRLHGARPGGGPVLCHVLRHRPSGTPAGAPAGPAGVRMIRIRGLQKSFGASRVLRGIDLDIADGEVVALIGRSGCGKTTLLRCINFLEEYEAGEIRLDGEPLWYRAGADGARRRVSEAEARRQRQQMGIVFQQYNLFPHMTALDNVVLGPRFSQGVALPDAEALGRRLLGRGGVESKMAAYPAQLSRGPPARGAIGPGLAS